MGSDNLKPSYVAFPERRTLDPDTRRRRDLDALKDSLRRAYPVAPVVQAVDPKFMMFLERLADLDLEKLRKG